MSFMLKIKWEIKQGLEAEFKANQEKLCAVMLEHPGVICYHVEYPSARVSEWTEIYATDGAFKAHLANEKGKAPLGAVVGACDKITCRCFGEADNASKEILKGFGTTYHESAKAAFVLHPRADKNSEI
jgi:quinol monooxygenase YgiN